MKTLIKVSISRSSVRLVQVTLKSVHFIVWLIDVRYINAYEKQEELKEKRLFDGNDKVESNTSGVQVMQ